MASAVFNTLSSPRHSLLPHAQNKTSAFQTHSHIRQNSNRAPIKNAAPATSPPFQNSSSALKPRLQNLPNAPSLPRLPRTKSNLHPRASASSLREGPASPTEASDPLVLELIEKLARRAEEPEGSNPRRERMNAYVRESVALASESRWPTNRDESYRFTNLKALRNCEIVPAHASPSEAEEASRAPLEADMARFSLGDVNALRVVVVDGVVNRHLSLLGDGEGVDKEGVLIGPLSEFSDDQFSAFVADSFAFSTSRGRKEEEEEDVFARLNGVGMREVVAVVVPEGRRAARPVHIVHLSSGSERRGAALMSCPRVLVLARAGSRVDLVEEFAPLSRGPYFVDSVSHVLLAPGASVSHSVVQHDARDSFNIKHTFVRQEKNSKYSLVEAQLGGEISRHNFIMTQEGEDTETDVSTFSLAGERQLQDLHSKLILSHPRGITNQLHKCIVIDSTGHAVFDGNVKVNREAQKTDASQLSRSLLMSSRGTINIKPNLQIVADDVKCTHGAAISDLEEDQIFYFRARGIDEASARSALVFSFGAEVIGKLPYPSLRTRVEEMTKGCLAAEGAMDSSIAAGLGTQ